MYKKPGFPVLVTGFGPFGTHKVNISWEIAKILPTLNLKAHGIDLTLHEVPVAYSAVDELVPRLWKTHKPRLVVHMGITSIGSEISLEVLAHRDGYKKLDIHGELPENESASGTHEVLRTGLDAEAVVEKLVNSTGVDVPIQVSTNAGSPSGQP